MLSLMEKRHIYVASEPVNFRMSIDGLASLVRGNEGTELYDGSVYVFYNKAKDKIKCLYWDRNGFVLYYKRLDKERFKFKRMTRRLQSITMSDLETLLAGMHPVDEMPFEREQLKLASN